MASVYSEEREKRRIKKRYKELLLSIGDRVDADGKEQIREAFELAVEAHKDRRRESGDPFIFHLISVAQIVVGEIGLGRRSIIAALLHEAVRGKQISLDMIQQKFGKSVSDLLTGLVKIAELGNNDNKIQADNFRNLLLSLSDDVRVILIKIADRLDLMRSMSYIDAEKQVRKSLETFYLYAPLAHRLGLYNIKSEMEDLSMKYTEPDAYKMIIKKLSDTKAKRDKFIKQFIEPIKVQLKKQDYKFEIKGRTKSIYSIWKKMQKQNVPFEEVYDLFAIRIILFSDLEKEKSECWNTYSMITDKYQPNPKRMRDWISVPKTNGYESLHTTVVGPDGRWVEVQIRTDRMNEVAEKGFAAHWKYKGIKSEQSLDDWLLKIRDILETPEQSENVIDSFKMNLYNKEVFVFTPNGDLKKFPHGSCLLDFAYDIHSDLGDTCIGGKINGKNITIKYVLQNGDIISVNTSKKQFPKPDWLGFVKTTKAKARVKQYLKEVKLKDADDGKEMLVRRLKNWKVPMSDKLFFDMIKAFKYKNALDFYSDIAKEKISLQDVKTYINSLTPKDDKVVKAEVVENHVVQPQSTTTSTSSDFLEIDNKLVNVDYKFARCCNPVMGDRVFGFITIGDGIKIHRDDCPNALQLKKSYPYRIVEVKWKDTDEQTSFLVNVKILGSGSGIMSSVTDIITKDPKVSMRAFFIDSDTVGEFAGRIQINVSDLKHLDYILRKILSVKGVIKASRMNS